MIIEKTRRSRQTSTPRSIKQIYKFVYLCSLLTTDGNNEIDKKGQLDAPCKHMQECAKYGEAENFTLTMKL